MSVSTLVLDLAPFLEYLPECINRDPEAAETPNSPIVTMFEQEAEQAGADEVRRARIILN